MKKPDFLRWIFAAAGLSLVASLPALAHEGHHHNAMGTIHSIEAMQLELKITEGDIQTFQLTAKTTYMRGETAANVDDLEVGERAVVMYETEDDEHLVLEVKLGAKEHHEQGDRDGHDGHGNGATSKAASAGHVKASEVASASSLREVEPRFVCMVNDTVFDQPQIPVEVGDKTYFGCCKMCEQRLSQDVAIRAAVDPVSGQAVDKATAVPAALPDGTVLYFESRETLSRWSDKPSDR